MDQAYERDRRIRELEERLALLSQASLRVNESLDFDTVLQGVMDSALMMPVVIDPRVPQLRVGLCGRRADRSAVRVQPELLHRLERFGWITV